MELVGVRPSPSVDALARARQAQPLGGPPSVTIASTTQRDHPHRGDDLREGRWATR